MRENDGSRPGGAWRRAPAVLALLVLVAGVFCADENPAKLRLGVVADSEVSIPAQVNRVRVWVVASRTNEGNLCSPTYRDFPLTRASDLPFFVDYYPDGQYDVWVAFRVEWFLNATPVAEREMIQRFPSEGTTEFEIRLDAVCVEREPPCPDATQCIRDDMTGEPMCTGLPPPGPFTSPSLIETPESCDPATPYDGGGD